MSITVGDIFTQFPSFKPEDMEKLVGNKNYDGRTAISLTNIASYKGQYAQDLSVFVAGREKQNYTKLLADGQRTQLNEQLGIEESQMKQNQNNPIPAYIPMDKSVFDYQRPEMA